MSTILSREDEYLLHEYQEANKLTIHVDELRSKLTSFFLTIAGSIVAIISFFLNKDYNPNYFGQSEIVVSTFLFFIAMFGLIIVSVIAKLRRVQLEHYRIINNIRTYFLDSNFELWNIVELSSKTLPKPSRKSGTYFWSFSIFLLNGYIIALALYTFCQEYLLSPYPFLISFIGLLVILFIQDKLYFVHATPPTARKYSDNNKP